MDLIFDIETDNYLEHCTKIHCIVAENYETGVVHMFDSRNIHGIELGVHFLETADLLIGHNIIDFDVRAIKKFYPNFKTPKLYDTLIAAKIAFPDIKEQDFRKYRSIINIPATMRSDLDKAKMRNIGKHSLEAYGIRLGEHKGDFGKEVGFETFSQEMLEYCCQDVRVNTKLYDKLVHMALDQSILGVEFEAQRICLEQTEFGFQFDYPKAEILLKRLQDRRQELLDEIESDLGGVFIIPLEVKVPKRDLNYKDVTRGSFRAGCPYQKIKIMDFNAGSRNHVSTRLIERYHWKPTEYGDDQKPTLSEEVLDALDIPAAKYISEFLMIEKRLGMLSTGQQAWMKLYNEKTGAIHGKINTLGAATSRSTHSKPNLAQIPATRSPWGTECRELFTVEKGWKLFGTDASGLELRMLAHYMTPFDKGEYTDLILNGDIHTANQNAAGLPTRDHAKTFIYALLYGAGSEKIGAIIEEGKKEGLALKKKFFKNTPAMKKLTEAVKEAAMYKGYVKGLDGRKIPIKSAHSALNFLLQGAGAIVCKMWGVEIHMLLTEAGYTHGVEFKQSVWCHDEYQIAFRPELITGDILGEISSIAIDNVGKKLEMRIKLESDWSVGDSYAETH